MNLSLKKAKFDFSDCGLNFLFLRDLCVLCGEKN